MGVVAGAALVPAPEAKHDVEVAVAVAVAIVAVGMVASIRVGFEVFGVGGRPEGGNIVRCARVCEGMRNS